MKTPSPGERAPCPPEQPRWRAREALKYLPPWMPRSVPAVNLRPFSSPDAALNAFAQLVTWRLNVDRALISLIDGDGQYILAEATKTSPLRSSQDIDAGNGLILGVAALPKDQGLCDRALSQCQENSVWVVNDIHNDSMLCGRDFARSNPDIKFYAATPIVINGLKIGVLCVYDAIARDTLEPSEEKFFVDTAAMLAQHLQLTKVNQAQNRSLKMFSALDSLMGQHSLGGSNIESQPCSAGSTPDFEYSSTSQVTGHLPCEKGEDNSVKSPTSVHETSAYSSEEERGRLKKTLRSNGGPDFLWRAGSLLLHGFNADGVVFYDIGSRAFNEQTTRTSSITAREYDSSSSDVESTEVSNTMSPGSQGSHDIKRPSPTLGNVLASCQSAQHPPTKFPSKQIRDKDLQRLVRIFPAGKIFHLDEDDLDKTSNGGDIDTFGSADRLAPGSLCQRSESNGPPQSQASSSNGQNQGSEARGARKSRKMLKKVFADARSIAFFPLWDSHRERWYAGGFVYSCDNKRLIFTAEDLRFLRAISLCIMGELDRQNWVQSEIQKEEFMSLISHELRTPLHGILAHCELLREVRLTPFQTTLLDTIDGCGHSLLDVINHILDRSVMVAKDKRNKKSKKVREPHPTAGVGDEVKPFHAEESGRWLEDVDLVAVTEEVICGLTSEMQFASNARQGYEKQVSLNLSRYRDLDRSEAVMVYSIHPKINWILRLRTGAFRRILTNLVGNSIKFTSEGTIEIELQHDDPKDENPICTVRLQVTDTGQGISESYLKHHLFQQFKQENPHSVGSGLGLSIVRSIVDELDGMIDVQSQKGTGTTVTVTFPCELVSKAPPVDGSKPLDYFKNTLLRVRKAAQGLTACFVTAPLSGEKSHRTQSLRYSRDSISKVCKEWFGLQIEHSDRLRFGYQRVNFVDESYLYEKSFSEIQAEIEDGADRSRAGEPFFTPTVFIGATDFVTLLHKDSAFQARDSQFFITNPCGPHQLERILSLCLDYMPHISHSPIETTSASNAAEVSPGPEGKGLPVSDVLHPSEEPDSGSTTREEPEIFQKMPIRENKPDASPKRTREEQQTSQDAPTKTLQPRYTETTQESTPPLAPTSLIFPSNAKSSPKMLLVEDNSVNMKILELCAKRLSLPYSLAFNGSQSVDLFEASPFTYDMIWMDIMMPVMDGIRATHLIRSIEKKVRRSETKAPVRIVALTGLNGKEIEGDAKAVGMDAFFTKPIKREILQQCVEEWHASVGSTSQGIEEDASKSC